MEYITYTATFTFPKSSVLGFAKWMQYQETIPKGTALADGTITEEETVNPENAFDFIARKAKEHNEAFVTGWANFLRDQEVQKQSDVIREELDTQIVQPVRDAIDVTYK
jgi:hypothetical protein